MVTGFLGKAKSSFPFIFNFFVVAFLILLTGPFLVIAKGKFFFAFLVFALNFCTGLFVLSRDFRNSLNRVFFALTFFVATWSFSLSMFRATGGFSWGRATYFFASFMPPIFFSFVRLFPKTLEEKMGLIDCFFYLVGAIIAILSLTTDLIVEKVVLVSWGLDLKLGRLQWVFALYFLGVAFWGFAGLLVKYKKCYGVSRDQIKYVFLGTFLTTIVGSLVAILLPLINYSNLYYLAPPSTVIMIGFIAYAITKHRLLDISVVISRALAEVLAVFFHGTIYLILVWFYVNYISAKIDFPFLVWTVAYGILVGQTHQSVRLFIQTTSDKVFLKGKYDYYKELSEISSRVTRTLSLENILSTLQRAFYEVLEVSNPRIYLWEDFDRPEVRELMEVKEMSFRGEDLVIPCRLEDRLIAIIVLGKKLSEDAYTDEDLRLLQVLANQTAVALDHTRTYEEIKQDYEASREKLLETERLLARSERIASLANLIREYNHEIKTPLAILRNELALLPDDPSLENFREKAIKAIERIKDIVESTLRLSDVGKRKIEDVNLNEVIEGSLKLFPPSGVEVVKELSPLPTIKGDSDDLKIVLVNLIKNAVEAMPQGGELKLKSYTEQEQDKTYVILEVKDTGVGIPKENLEKIFEPFFSTHVTKGRGLGLSIVFRVVREHGGKIQVESELGKGSTFRIALPSF